MILLFVNALDTIHDYYFFLLSHKAVNKSGTFQKRISDSNGDQKKLLKMLISCKDITNKIHYQSMMNTFFH